MDKAAVLIKNVLDSLTKKIVLELKDLVARLSSVVPKHVIYTRHQPCKA